MSNHSKYELKHFSKDQKESDAFNQFMKSKKLFLVVSKNPSGQVTDFSLKNFIFQYQQDYIKIWENDEFIVYNQTKGF